MRRLIPASLIVVIVTLAATIFLAASPDPIPGLPQYTSDNRLLPPSDYREWIFLSSGLGMSYSAQAGHEMFTNVFVPQWAYREFMKSGKWPDINFDEDTKSASANPKAGCWNCHEQHAAVEHVFVQFYPTLKPVAKKFGKYREAAENVQ